MRLPLRIESPHDTDDEERSDREEADLRYAAAVGAWRALPWWRRRLAPRPRH
jgi:hypothetical protein